ncbi:MAG: non-ribosomal peptide synthetase, partial [Chloroflexi bacterium]|nr:non-ribosomal peptide synthetase [Chloroflexota bacterium]
MNTPSLKERLAQLPPERQKQLLAELARRKNQQIQPPKQVPPIQAQGDETGQKSLSFAQRRLWFLDQFTPASSAYNIPAVIRLRGKLDASGLEISLNAIIRRHLVLRQIYTTIDEEPALIPHPDPRIQLMPTAVSEVEIQTAINEANAQPFDLSHDLPIRAQLLRVADDDHLLLLVMHHIASDGWSMGVFFKELSAFYNSHVTMENGFALPDLPFHYADYAQWQQEWLTGEVLDDHLTYWQKQLASAPTTLELPTDRPRPPTRSFAGAIHAFELDEKLATAVYQTARKANVSLYMFLLTAFHILLYRYSGKTDILIGSPVAGRNQIETESLIGLFLNTIVIRGRMENNPAVQELLKQIRTTTLDAFEHQHVPFEKLVEAMQLERHLSHNPLIQVLFNIHNTPEAVPLLSELTAEFLPTEVHTSKFDLSLAFAEQENGLRGTISY